MRTKITQLILAGLLLAGVVAVLVKLTLGNGQQGIAPIPYTWKDEGLNPDGLIVPVVLSEKTLKREMPDSFDFRVFIGGSRWEVLKVVGWEIQGKKPQRMDPPPFHGPPEKDGNRMLEVWQLDELDSEKRYRLDVYLHQKHDGSAK